VDDLAAACLHLMDVYSSPDIVNIGTGVDVTIRELTELVRDAVGWEGEIVWDATKPDGTPRKLLDVSKLTGAARGFGGVGLWVVGWVGFGRVRVRG